MKVTISKHWNNPKISTVVNFEGIEMAMELDDFCQALADEIGPITWVFRDATFRSKFETAKQKVLSKVKEESAKVV